MDYADNGNLQSKIRDRFKVVDLNTGKKKFFKEDQLFDYFTQICSAIKYCHDRNILHRDIKSENVFCTKDDKLKLGDFGIARVLSNKQSFAKTLKGTYYYMSPEMLSGREYNLKSDIWSLGVLFYEMAALELPFVGTVPQLHQKILKGYYAPLTSDFSPEVSKILSMML